MSAASTIDRTAFEALAGAVCEPAPGLDRSSLYLAAESSDFLRFNHALLRQATQVEQRYATVAVVRGARRAEATASLTGDTGADITLLRAERDALVAQLDFVPEDRHLLLPETVVASERDTPGRLPSAAGVIDTVTARGAGLDLVGFYAGGPVVRAFADSRGQRNWHRVESFHFDWCLYHAADKAVKTSYAGTHWDAGEVRSRIGAARERLALLALPARLLAPGAYRAWFTPTAVAALAGLLGWGGFGLKARQTDTSPLGRLARGEARLHPSIDLCEDTAAGVAPAFTAAGFAKPGQVPLVTRGRAAGTLNSPRSAREFGLPPNAGDEESPDALSMAGGTLDAADALAALGTGVYISNLWYLNFSDRQACRATGMTRFACFWVEDGQLVAPIGVMRFDDSLLRIFGDGLLGLTRQVELVPDSGTWGSRQLASATVPGALVEGFRLTL